MGRNHEQGPRHIPCSQHGRSRLGRRRSMSAVKIPPSPPLSKGGIKVVMVDNYDSFTYNLVQYLGELGADVIVVRNDAIDVAGIRALHPAAVVISPGPCTPF